MEHSGPVTLFQVEEALRRLRGEASSRELLDELTRLRNGDYLHYMNKENYEKTAWQVVMTYTPGYKKFKGPVHFEKTGRGKIRLVTPTIGPYEEPQYTPTAADIGELSQPGRVQQVTYRILRDTKLAREVKALAQYQCQICGETIRLVDGQAYAEAHHVRPLGAPHDGPDVRDNILCVCPNDHVKLDYGAILLESTSIPSIRPEFVKYHNDNIYSRTTQI